MPSDQTGSLFTQRSLIPPCPRPPIRSSPSSPAASVDGALTDRLETPAGNLKSQMTPPSPCLPWPKFDKSGVSQRGIVDMRALPGSRREVPNGPLLLTHRPSHWGL
ncbi:hypothetical protein DPEC_G00148180 [Dallia pectoralis]|uniref:Uncharacterized protein n=1 Tax=Dallia pectoralis TaxID=75939 RepID=A0ACC2GIW2_DALPE|nr:hypothetical protein DPEC_G00148180 [Dallia pectoralis]